MPKSIYTKLTPRHRTLGGYSQLWLAPDHILLLRSTRIAEEYKRFALTDIQSIVVTERPTYGFAPQIVAILAALAFMVLQFDRSTGFIKWASEVMGAIVLLWAIVDIARGARCRCFLHTRISSERLLPVSRMPTAHKLLGKLRPMIEAVQGALPETYVPMETPTGPEPPNVIPSPGYLPEIVFGTFLANAILIWASIQFPKVQDFLTVLLNTLFAEGLLAVVALLRRRGRDKRVIIYVVLTLSLVGIGFDAVMFTRETFSWYMTAMNNAANGIKTAVPMRIFPADARRQALAWVWRAAAGVIGLIAAFWERRK